VPGKPKQPASRRTTQAANRSAAQKSVLAARSGTSRWMSVGLPIGLVIALVAVLVVVKVASGSSKPKSGQAATGASASVAAKVTSVPQSVLNQVGLGGVTAPPKAISGAALTADGKPRVLYVGAEWCPYCAAERWGLAVALSRFGSLTGLGEVTSSGSDVFPNTPTLTFHGASYTSDNLSLTAKEIYSNQVSGSSYAPLDALDAADGQLFQGVGGGSFPFLDIGGRYLFSASYSPGTLSGLTQAQIAADLANPDSKVGKAIDGTANLITAAICMSSNQQPANVCSAPGVVAAKAALPKAT